MLKKVLKDEEGLTLVELLAVVVIMSIIAGIAAVSISKVIQRTREDAAVSNVQQLMSAANLYDIQEPDGFSGTDPVDANALLEAGTIKSVSFLKSPDKVTFDKVGGDTGDQLEMKLSEDGILMAGNKKSKALTLTEDDVANLNRDKLFGEGSDNQGGSGN